MSGQAVTPPYCRTCGRFTGHWPGCDFGLRGGARGTVIGHLQTPRPSRVPGTASADEATAHRT